MTDVFGPYTPIRRAGNTVFVSGQIGIDPLSKTAATDITNQTNQALKNMKTLLEQEGLSLNNVVKTTVYLTNMDDFQAMNSAYEQWFEGPRPARSAISVKELPRVGGQVTLLVEIEAVAITT